MKEYKYPHDFPYHFAVQDYMKEKLNFYEPGILGEEKVLKRRLDFLRSIRNGDRKLVEKEKPDRDVKEIEGERGDQKGIPKKS